jgi:hypothetical protein
VEGRWSPRRTEVTFDVVRSEISSELSNGRSAALNKVALMSLPWHVAAVLRQQSLLRQAHGEFSSVRYNAASFNFQYPVVFLFKVTR